ncbi:glutathione transferase GstA [Pseudomonas sp. RP23018S]|uniref:glutathione transferase GstA n=1 Tax=Pseudomonas sp. RP23018S TaxID=3096037 RepID=UPI002ACA91B8|nr:glutathione transferase GstA [Pseudomonas sp. RP23018S]MDZ5601843.1 glutathione transferase GstA [Pseudomonas sp. RP23018S]
MKLYFAPYACSLASHIALRELALPFTLIRVNNQSKRTADGRDFYQINPKGYVAALELADGTVLTEAPAILQYLADLRPETGLAPANGTLQRTELQAQLSFIGSELHAGMSPLFNDAIPDQVKAVLRERLSRRMAYMERVLAENDYTCGEHFTVADAYLFTVLGWTDRLSVDLSAFPALVQFRQRVAARPSVIDALQAEAASAPVA